MTTRFVIAAFTVAMMVSPSLAQTPETSAEALAAPQAKSEKAIAGTDSGKASGTERATSAKRAAADLGSGKTPAKATAKR
jgi:hypothetical protein